MKIAIIISCVAYFFLSCMSHPKSGDLSNNSNKEKRTLYLIRHAKSSHKDSSLADFDRPLAKRGKEDAALIGSKLKEKRLKLDYMLISPSQRTKSTAKRLTKEFNYNKDSIVHDTMIYRCSKTRLIEIIENLDSKYKSVAIVGHNPATTQTANYFQKDTIFENVPTCGVVAIEFESNSWQELTAKSGKFLYFEYPKKYKTK